MSSKKKYFMEMYRGPKYGAGFGSTLRKAWKKFKKGYRDVQPLLRDALKLGEEVTRPLADSYIDSKIGDENLRGLVKGTKNRVVREKINRNVEAPTRRELGDSAKEQLTDYLTKRGQRVLGIEPETELPGSGFGRRGLFVDDMTRRAWHNRKSAPERSRLATGSGIRVDRLPAKWKNMLQPI